MNERTKERTIPESLSENELVAKLAGSESTANVHASSTPDPRTPIA